MEVPSVVTYISESPPISGFQKNVPSSSDVQYFPTGSLHWDIPICNEYKDVSPNVQ